MGAQTDNRAVMETILQKIREAPRIMLFRHYRPDGDCVGATKGLQEILRCTYPDKEVLLIDGERSDYLAFLGPDDAPVPDEVYADALGIVLDTGNAARISNPKYALCREIIKIDHHINVEPYGDYNWVEEERSAACEMVAAFYAMFREELKLNWRAATCLYAGMVTDSGRFRYEGVSGDTLRLAALLLDAGVDRERLYAHLYLREFETLKFQAYLYEHMGRTPHGVAHLYVGCDMQAAFGLTFEAASACVSYMDSIRGCLCWMAFIETGEADGAIRVRLRSRFLPVNRLAERYRGGGHAFASGATVYGEDEVRALLAEADEMVRMYKETHEDWM